MTAASRCDIQEAGTVTEHQENAHWNAAEWHGKMLVDREGEKIGKLQDVYVDVENDEPQFATVKEGFIGRHLTFVPLGGIKVGPDELQVTVTKRQITSAPNIEQHGEELSQDELITLHEEECLGACEKAPVVSIDFVYHDDVTPDRMRELVASLQAGEVPAPSRGEPMEDFRAASRLLAGLPPRQEVDA